MTANSRELGRRGLWWSIACLVLLTLGLRSVAAQAPSNQFGEPSIRRPTTSPYLNLFRNQGNNRSLNFGLNYQRLVRPEQDLRNYSARLNSQVNTLQNDFDSVIAPDGSVTVPGSGHQTSFMNTGGYFSGGAAARGGSQGSSGFSGKTNGGGFGAAGGFTNRRYGQIGSRMGSGGGQNMLGSRSQSGRSFGSPPRGQRR